MNKLLKSILLTVTVTAALTMGSCTEKRNYSFDGIPQYVTDAAAGEALAHFEEERSITKSLYGSSPYYNFTYTDWKLTDVKHVYTYDNFYGHKLELYMYNYRFLSDNPTEMMLPGSMEVDSEGWVVPDYANSRYLICENGHALFAIFSNDSSPGSELFNSDLFAHMRSRNIIKPTD